jgi:ribosomal protein L37AE/L43A
MREHACPICRQGTLERGEGRLDQSGDSYLPTAVWRCPRCEYARFEPVPQGRWVPAAAPVAVMAAASRAAEPVPAALPPLPKIRAA